MSTLTKLQLSHANYCFIHFFFFSSRRRHTRCLSDWSSDVCSSDLYPMQIKVDFLCRDSILAAPLVLDLVLLLDLAKRSSELRGIGIQEWLSFYFKSPMTAPRLYPEHDLFIQSMKLKNTMRHLMGEEMITHLGLEYYD